LHGITTYQVMIAFLQICVTSSRTLWTNYRISLARSTSHWPSKNPKNIFHLFKAHLWSLCGWKKTAQITAYSLLLGFLGDNCLFFGTLQMYFWDFVLFLYTSESKDVRNPRRDMIYRTTKINIFRWIPPRTPCRIKGNKNATLFIRSKKVKNQPAREPICHWRWVNFF
jgi:hypothetical protein